MKWQDPCHIIFSENQFVGCLLQEWQRKQRDDLIDGYSYLHPLLTYFAFDGTGTKDSDNPAELILEFKDLLKQKTWTYYSKENYIQAVWNRLVFSIRGKGLSNKSKKNKQNKLWIRTVDDKEKGALNVRIEK